MSAIFDHTGQWHDNKEAFQAALADLQDTAGAVGLVLRQAVDSSEGWPHVLRAEVRPSGAWRVLASLDVGLSEHGAMLLRTSPGEARMFSRFRARDRIFYLRRFCRLIETALRSGAVSRYCPPTPIGGELRQFTRKGGRSWALSSPRSLIASPGGEASLGNRAANMGPVVLTAISSGLGRERGLGGS
jgi:hypothetical protein